ncbi:MAG: DegT/DnrJ/EryC1/StrS family aminotransferase [Cyclobacteriaceae bacterium]|nr:DegT/DnrJ/EryC1/StrS family aminotransferase [Cyclobacteriaceae bacterium]
MQIPFVNLRLQYESIRPEIDGAMESVFRQAQFIGGEPVTKFESEFARLLSMPHCISTGNGTDSLFIILKALNIGAGDEVITPAFSCIPSAETISLTGATPVFCDVDAEHYTLNPEQVKKKITAKTKAVIAVHLYGQAAPVVELKKICEQHNLLLIEDCAQAHFSKDSDAFAGTIGVAGAFSFYPTKSLGAYGDAGCVVTNNTILAERMRRLRNHGALVKDDHELEGTNSRMDTLQAAILNVKLKYLPQWNARRKEIAQRYIQSLCDINQLQLPVERPGSTHTYHLFCIRTQQRNALKKNLAENGIETLIHYPKGLPYTPAYRHLNHTESDFPVTAALQNEVLSLPLYPELTNPEVDYVAQAVRQYFLRYS